MKESKRPRSDAAPDLFGVFVLWEKAEYLSHCALMPPDRSVQQGVSPTSPPRIGYYNAEKGTLNPELCRKRQVYPI